MWEWRSLCRAALWGIGLWGIQHHLLHAFPYCSSICSISSSSSPFPLSCLSWLLTVENLLQEDPTTSVLIDPPHLPWTVYAYDPDGLTWERVMPRNPNVMGYPFPPNTLVVSFSFPLFFLLSLSFFFLFFFFFRSLTFLSLNCSPPSKSMRSWYGWLGISS